MSNILSRWVFTVNFGLSNHFVFFKNILRVCRQSFLYLHNMPRLLTLILLFLFYHSGAQDISGTWRGNYGKNLVMLSLDRLEVDIELYNDSLIRGSSHLYYGKDKYEHYKIKGWYRQHDSLLYFSETEVIAVKLGSPANNVAGSYTMKLHVSDTTMLLEGKWKENSTQIQSMATKVWLQKPVPRKRDTIKVVPVPPVVTTSKPVVKPTPSPKPERLLRTIEVDSTEQDSIRIEIVDNGKLDNDMVSVYIDDNLVIERQVISHHPIVIYTSVSKTTPRRMIKMHAVSYGAQPPCTARMSIITPKTSYAVDVVSNYASNGTIMIKLVE